MYMCVGGCTHLCDVHMDAKGGHWVSCFITFCIISLRLGFFLIPVFELLGWASGQQTPMIITAGVLGMLKTMAGLSHCYLHVIPGPPGDLERTLNH